MHAILTCMYCMHVLIINNTYMHVILHYNERNKTPKIKHPFSNSKFMKLLVHMQVRKNDILSEQVWYTYMDLR